MNTTTSTMPTIEFDDPAILEPDPTPISRTPLEQLLASDKSRVLSQDEERALLRRSKKGDLNARNTLIEHNVRLMMKLAGKFRNVPGALETDELVSEATIAIIRAIEKFDENKAGKLSTYATWWIRQRMSREGVVPAVHIPVDVRTMVPSAVRRLTNEHGYEPTDEQVLAALPNTRLTLDMVTRCRAAINVLSLDAPRKTDDADSGTLHEVIADQRDLDLDAFVDDIDNQATIAALLAELDDDDTDLLARRYGMRGYGAQPLEDIARDLGVERIDVARAEHRVLRKLRKTAEPA